jgi:large subunit ribosomal protein L22
MEAVAKLRNQPTSPRKMRLLADLIRGMAVENALATLEHHPKHPARNIIQSTRLRRWANC